jgi:hypothetical protein
MRSLGGSGGATKKLADRVTAAAAAPAAAVPVRNWRRFKD